MGQETQYLETTLLFWGNVTMNKYMSYIKYFLLVSCIIFAAAGCSTKKARKLEDMGHAELLEKGLKQLDNGNMATALQSLLLVKDRYPYTESAVIASLKLADTYFGMGEYPTAHDLYAEFERFHPDNENIPYVKFQRGMCFFKQMRGFDREQKYALGASIEFVKLINEYPDHEYSIKARRYYRECLLNRAKFEIFTGNFYYNQKKYLAAFQRYNYAIENFPDVGQYHEALEKIHLCKIKMAELNIEPLTAGQ